MPPLPPYPPLASLADLSPPSQSRAEGSEEAISSITENTGFIAGAVGGGVLLLLLLAATGRLLAAACGVLYHRRVLRARAAAALRASALRPPLGAKRRSISRKVSLARRKSISLKVFLDRLPGRGSSATVEEPRAPAVPPIKATIDTTMQDPLDGYAPPSIADPIEGRTAEGEAPIPVHMVQLRQSRVQLRQSVLSKAWLGLVADRLEGRTAEGEAPIPVDMVQMRPRLGRQSSHLQLSSACRAEEPYLDNDYV